MKHMKKSTILAILLFVVFAASFIYFSNTATTKKENQTVRVITTYKPATDIVLALGGVTELVGVHDGAKKEPLLMNLDENKAENLIEVGSKKNGLNIEQIIALKPDVVIMYPTKESDETLNQLAAQNIKVVSINPETIDSLQSDIIQVGNSIGKSENAEKLVNYYSETLSEITERLSSVSTKKTVYLAGSNGVLSTCSGDFFQHELIERAGGIDVASDLKGGWNDVSVEQVIAWDPQVIASVMYCPNGSPTEIMGDPTLQTVTAVKNNDVYQMPSNISAWDMPQPSSILSILWLSSNLYPDQFADWDLHKTANEFYKTYYGKSFDDLGGTLVE